LNRVEQITGKKVESITIDVTDKSVVRELFQQHKFYAVLHLAALKAVGESCQKPLEYYSNNVNGTLNVLAVIYLFIESFLNNCS
jgi:UDP-glucose 4-epimerase